MHEVLRTALGPEEMLICELVPPSSSPLQPPSDLQ